jgi:hypothetical protein
MTALTPASEGSQYTTSFTKKLCDARVLSLVIAHESIHHAGDPGITTNMSVAMGGSVTRKSYDERLIQLLSVRL